MKKLWSLALLALLVPLAACGSSDPASDEPEDEPKETTTTEEAPDDDTVAFDDWADEVDQICADSGEAIDELGEPADLEEFATMAEDAADLVAEARDDIEAVGTPDENQDEVEEWLALLDEQADLYPDVIEAAEANDEDALTEVASEIEDLQTEARAIAADLGLDECAKDDSEDDPDTTDTTATAASLTFDEWVVAADAVCVDFEAQASEFEDAADNATTVADLAPAFEGLLPLYDDFIVEIEALGIPSDGPDEVQVWVELIGQAPELIEPLAEAAAAGDEELFTELAEGLETYDQSVGEAATAIGFQECSQD